MKCKYHGIENCVVCDCKNFPMEEDRPSYTIVAIVFIAAIGFIALLVGEYWV